MLNGKREKSAEGTSKGCSGVKDGHPPLDLVSLIPDGHEKAVGNDQPSESSHGELAAHVDAGKKPASATPRKKRAARSPSYEFTMPMRVMTSPQKNSRTEIQSDGRIILRMILLGTSKLSWPC